MEADVFGPPSCPGIYAVVVRNFSFGSEHVLYVGSAANIRERVRGHLHPYGVVYERLGSAYIVGLRFLVCDNYREREREAIRSLRPVLNIHHNG